MRRDEPVWYYRLGDRTLGPVAWEEIEELTEDTVQARELLVARGGDESWRTADQVLAEHPELAATPEPSEAAREVVESAARGREWSVAETDEEPPAPEEVPRPARATIGMTPESGLGGWISQAWEIVTGDLWAFVGATFLAGVISMVTCGICTGAMQAGLTLMAIRRYRKQDVSAGMVFEGFRYFVPGLVVLLIVGLIAFVPAAIVTGAAVVATGASLNVEDPEAMEQVVNILRFAINGFSLLVWAGAFYAMPLVVDREMGGWEAIVASWEHTKTRYASYLGTQFVLQTIAGLGALACLVGVLVTAPLLPAGQVAAYMYHMKRR